MKVGIYAGNGVASKSLKRCWNLLKGNFELLEVRDEIPEIDVFIIPGGFASEISLSLGKANLHKIKNMVKKGMKYIGICAGSYLAIKGYWEDRTLTGELVLIKAQHPKIEDWNRGNGYVKVSLKDHPISWGLKETITMWYENGPIFSEGDYEIIGTFDDEINEIGSPVVMKGSPAIIASEYGKGKVILFSPHPEFSRRTVHKLLLNAVDY
ncbi:MAG: Uncharacterized protein XD64_1325 [Thermotoga sp. 47_83]|nr:MAG: Uncharacterized protein XD64_1325 [Thermotoga sp. 47_83]